MLYKNDTKTVFGNTRIVTFSLVWKLIKRGVTNFNNTHA